MPDNGTPSLVSYALDRLLQMANRRLVGISEALFCAC